MAEQSRRGRNWPAVLGPGAAIFLLSFLVFHLQLSHLAPRTFVSNNGPFFGADTADVCEAMSQVTFGYDMCKHLLFSAFMFPLVQAAHLLLGGGTNRAILAVLGLVSAANVTLAWLVFRAGVKSLPLSLVLTALYGFSFANLVIFSLPETYALSNSLALVFFWLFLAEIDARTPAGPPILGAVAGLAGLFNPPLLSLLLLPLVKKWGEGGSRRLLIHAALSCSTALLVFCLPYAIIHGRSILGYSTDYAGEWACLRNFLKLKYLALVLASFFLFAVVAPLGILAGRMKLAGLGGYLHNPLAAAALVLYLGLMAAAFRQLAKAGDKFAVPILVWIACLLAFYTYFNPQEAFLYSSQTLFPLFLLQGRGLTARVPLSRRTWAALAGLALLLLANNVPIFYRHEAPKNRAGGRAPAGPALPAPTPSAGQALGPPAAAVRGGRGPGS